jgi:hypothetical protein
MFQPSAQLLRVKKRIAHPLARAVFVARCNSISFSFFITTPLSRLPQPHRELAIAFGFRENSWYARQNESGGGFIDDSVSIVDAAKNIADFVAHFFGQRLRRHNATANLMQQDRPQRVVEFVRDLFSN